MYVILYNVAKEVISLIFEKITYEEDFPINIKVVNVKNYPLHYHQDIEFIYVLQGEIMLKNVCHNYHLKEGDVFTNNGHEIHGMHAITEDNVIAIIQVSNRFFTQYFPELPKACFMTFVRNEKTSKIDALRKMILIILMDYSYGSINYKSKCISQMIDTIKYMNQYFNLFAFEGQIVTSFKNDNPVIINRISKIINYIYENHTNKISLDELAEIEHLSSYYLSHLIKESMGINFQEFLCFARIEMSELHLLDTDNKISTIAKEVGFSTTSYYKKYFKKWFGCQPDKYRELNMQKVLSTNNQPDYKLLSDNEAVTLIRHRTSALRDQDANNSVIHNNSLIVKIKPEASVIQRIEHSLEVQITEEDYISVGLPLFHMIAELNATNVVLLSDDKTRTSTSMIVINTLGIMGYNATVSSNNILDDHISAGNDSIAAAIYLINKYFMSRERILKCRLRDSGNRKKIFKGLPTCLTASLLPKPLFYAYRIIKNVKGNLIKFDKNYYIVQADNGAFIFIVMNYNNKILNLVSRNATIFETNKVIHSFNDELNIDFSIPVESGRYSIIRYTMTHSESLLSYLHTLGYSDEFPFSDICLNSLNVHPLSQIDVKEVSDCLNVSSTIRGAGIEVTLINKI